jgi:hypothetical protein
MSNRKTEKFINRAVDQKIVKKRGWKKMNAEKVVSEKVVEKAGNSEKVVENAGKVERKVEKTVNGQNGQIPNQTTKMTLAELLERKMKALNVDLSEIELLNVIVIDINTIESQIQKLNELRIQKLNEAKSIYEKLNAEAKNILQILGLINMAEIEKTVYGKAQIAKTQITRAEKGNGLTDKRIVFQGKEYRIASYFMRKYGISGGMKGLEEWARSRGYSLKVEDDVIFIV